MSIHVERLESAGSFLLGHDGHGRPFRCLLETLAENVHENLRCILWQIKEKTNVAVAVTVALTRTNELFVPFECENGGRQTPTPTKPLANTEISGRPDARAPLNWQVLARFGALALTPLWTSGQPQQHLTSLQEHSHIYRMKITLSRPVCLNTDTYPTALHEAVHSTEVFRTGPRSARGSST